VNSIDRQVIPAFHGRATHGGQVLALAVLGLSACRADAKVGTEDDIVHSGERRQEDVVAKLDGELRRTWIKAKVTVAPEVTDDGYLRRATLDLVGRMPTPAERAVYLQDPPLVRRGRLIERLVASDAYAEYWSTRLGDLLFDEQVRISRKNTEPARVWLREQLAENRPWNELVYDLLTAEGDLDYEGSPGFIVAYLRIADIAALTSTVSDRFLGVQIQCAQCHDSDPWTREDFWGLAAGFATAKVRVEKEGDAQRIRLVDRPRGKAKLVGENGQVAPGADIPALFRRPVARNDGESQRQAMARAIVESDLLASAAVGRIWTDLFGRGLLDPWNDLGNGAEDPLLALLARSFRESGYDLARLLRTICASSAYARGSDGDAATRVEAERGFARAAIRPLSSHQVYESLLVVTGADRLRDESFVTWMGSTSGARRHEYERAFEDGRTRSHEDGNIDITQSLILLNDGMTHAGSLARIGSPLADILGEHEEPKARVNAIYLHVLVREPSTSEVERSLQWIAARPSPAGYEDLMYALLNSVEFRTNH